MSRLCLVAAFLLVVPASALAGPNAGGTLIVHSNPSSVLNDGGYCGRSGLTSCADANVSLPSDPGVIRIFHVLAAFAPTRSPRLSVATFGVQYDADKLVLMSHGHCGDSELTMENWPSPGSGTQGR